MVKKNYSLQSNEAVLSSVIGWKPPVFHQRSECYVSFSAFDPSFGRLRRKRIMLDRIKGKRQQREYADALMKRLTEKLMDGWNPWIEASQPLEYTKFADVLLRYREYLQKLFNEHNLREESLKDYTSKVNVLENWIHDKRMNITYSYQWDHHNVSKFLDYIFVERNNTVITRNNYLTWLKTFSKYLLERGYISQNPTQSFERIKNRRKKERDVIPDEVMEQIRDYLLKKNKHFLLACEILHYLFVRPRELSFLKIGDFQLKKKTLILHGEHTKNGNDATITLPSHVIKLMIELNIFSYPSQYYLFSSDFIPGVEHKSEKFFRDYWHRNLRKDLGFSMRYKFYSLKDTGITNMLRANTDVLSVRDQARHSSILITDIYTPKDIKEANELILNYRGIL
jgi:integrase